MSIQTESFKSMTQEYTIYDVLCTAVYILITLMCVSYIKYGGNIYNSIEIDNDELPVDTSNGIIP